ncbi:MAG: hypothetical protein HY236_00880 [Acidobacteria bacterium]|nr:hypothetical protein [Acidobacteriota bacterium]
MRKWTIGFAALFLAAWPALPQAEKPNFSGRWELDKARSKLGPAPAPDAFTESIDHKEPQVIISGVTKSAVMRENTSFIKLTTDGVENLNMMNGNEFRTRTRWEGGKLVTVVKGMGGLELTEIRFLSKDGKTQTVDTYMGAPKGEPQQRRVMVKTSP